MRFALSASRQQDADGLAMIDLEAHWEVAARIPDERLEARRAAGDPGRVEIARTGRR